MSSGLKVLIVEDEALIGVSLERVLGRMGYQTVGVASSGEEGIELAFLTHPDVILMDIRIKGSIDGIEASKRINERLSVPVIFLTAYNDDQYIDRCVKTESYGFLTKPAGSQEIKAAIEIAVSRHRAFKAEEGMRKKESVLKAVGFAAEQFLSSSTFEEGIKKTLSNLGCRTGFERVSLFENIYDENGKICMKPFYSWDSQPGKSDTLSNTLPYSAMAPKFEEMLRKGEIIFGNIEDFSMSETNPLVNSAPDSVLVVPGFSGDLWWGFICFETSRMAENWSEGEKEGLCAAATFIGSAILNKKLNDDIKSNEEQYRSFYTLLRTMCDNVPDMIWAKDPEGRYTFANRSFCQDILGIKDTGEPVGKDIHHFIEKLRQKNSEDSRIKALEERIKCHSPDMIAYKKPFQSIFEFRDEDKNLYFDSYEVPFCDEDGNFLGTVGCGRNVTKEKEYENSLLEINARFTAFMDKLPACAYIRDRAGNIIYANQYTKDLFGAENWSLLFSPEIYGENDPGAIEEINKRIRKSGPLEREGTFILSDKKPHTLKFILFPISYSGIEDLTGAIAIDVTKTKEAELNLFESEEKYRLLFETANDAIYVGDGEVCLDCNSKMCQIIGYEKDEIVGHSVADFSPEYQPDKRRSADRVKELIQESLNGEEIEIFDWQAKKKSGEIIDTRVSMNSVKIGSKNHIFLILRDITEEKIYEKALRESETRYRSLVDNSPIGIEIFQDQKIVYASPVLADITSMSIEEILSRPFSDLVHPDDLKFILELNRRRLEGFDDVQNNYKIRIIDGKGDIKVLDVNVVLIEWNNRPATLNFLLDITEKEKAEDALKESEERYRGVVENARINIMITQEGRICYVNPSTAEFLGLSNENLISRPFLEFIYEDDREMVLRNHILRLSGEKSEKIPEKYILRAYNYKNELRTMDFNTTVIQWKGKPATLNFLLDITDQIESTELIQKALIEKTVLLQEVHHRVKNNLALINSLLSMQARKASSDDVINNLRDAETRIFSIAAVHEGLYRSSSISGIPADEHFRNLGREIISSYSPDVKIQFDVFTNDCELGLNDAIPISLIINELLTNSIKYAFAGRKEGRIRIEMDCTNDSVSLLVEDDGVGIPPDFSLYENESLGLTLVRNIVEMQLEGTINLERDGGTRWIISMPKV
ncbi:MAG: PAS domain S-box protein [Methanomicrobiaceae archaeon]|nr:PAS domain S-box protein [Methanomicrobiaceae archaeon]